jgi:hypothetical protein
MLSHPQLRTDLFRRPLDKVLVTDFFGGVQSVELTDTVFELEGSNLLVDGRKIKVTEPSGSNKISEKENVVKLRPFLELIPLNFLVGCFIFAVVALSSIF